MAKTESTMAALGSLAPQFSLPDIVSGKVLNLTYSSAPATVIMFICNHCPFVKHVNHELTKLAKDYMNKGVNFFAINSNEYENYPEDSPEHMLETAKKEGYPFPYLYDETQEVAKAYFASCTPDFFVYDNEYKLRYRGQLDDSRPGNLKKVDGASIRAALDAILTSKPVASLQIPSLGCSIKWKKEQ